MLMERESGEFLWVERYRPHTIHDTILPKELKATFQHFVDNKAVPNLLLSGKSGIGKTTVAKAMLDEIDADYITVNGSLEGRQIDILRNEILNYATSLSLTNSGRKYVIIDEADYLNPNTVQPALRNFMEEYSDACGFILTCNYKNKIIDSLHSRCSVIEFQLPNQEKPVLAAQFFKRVQAILTAENIPFEKPVLAELINKFFPDLRRTINELQRYSAIGRIDSGILSNFQDATLKKLIDLMKNKNFTDLRKWVSENSDFEPSDLYRAFYDQCSQYFKTESIPILILLLAKYQYQDAFVADHQINTSACFLEIMAECQFK